MNNAPTDTTPTDTAATGITPEQARVEQDLVDTVVTSFDNTADPRLKQLLQSLTRHLHAFIREVRLTETEWNQAIEFLTAAGHITDDKRQEFILLSDVLGASMQTIAVNNEAVDIILPVIPASNPRTPTRENLTELLAAATAGTTPGL